MLCDVRWSGPRAVVAGLESKSEELCVGTVKMCNLLGIWASRDRIVVPLRLDVIRTNRVYRRRQKLSFQTPISGSFPAGSLPNLMLSEPRPETRNICFPSI